MSFASVLIEMDVTKPLPDVVQVMDEKGKLFDQKVVYDWTPPFCKKCGAAGHDCAKPKKQQDKRVGKGKQKWVPKVPQAAAVPVTDPAKVNENVEMVKEAPAPQQPQVTSDDDGGWRVVSRRTRDKGKRPMVPQAGVSNAYQVLLEEEPDEGVDDPGGSGLSPYLS